MKHLRYLWVGLKDLWRFVWDLLRKVFLPICQMLLFVVALFLVVWGIKLAWEQIGWWLVIGLAFTLTLTLSYLIGRDLVMHDNTGGKGE
jgi:hypothetical protein